MIGCFTVIDIQENYFMALATLTDKTVSSLDSQRQLVRTPVYSIPIASQITGISQATIRSWLYGYSYNSYGDERWFASVLTPYPKEKLYNPNRLKIGFDTIIELAYLKELIACTKSGDKDFKVLGRIRQVIKILEEEFCTDRPLLHPSSFGIFDTPFNEKLVGLVGDLGHLRYVIANLRSRIYWAEESCPTKFFPCRQRGMFLSVNAGNPSIMIEAKQIAIDEIVAYFQEGQTIKEISKKLKIEDEAVQSAIRFAVCV